MLAHPEESLLQDGRALNDLSQGVTLEVMGEDSMGPLTPHMKELAKQRQSDIHYDIDWTTLGEYLDKLQKRGIAPNVASFVGAGTVRTNVLGEADVQPTQAQLETMQALVHQAMEEGALGVTTALIYSPNGHAKTPELIALASESARCMGGPGKARRRGAGVGRRARIGRGRNSGIGQVYRDDSNRPLASIDVLRAPLRHISNGDIAMYATRNGLSLSIRTQSVALLNRRLADAVDLGTQVKQAHWNVRGASFIALHELFDDVASRVKDQVDLLAERITALGGVALGTVEVAAKSSSLKPYPLDIRAGVEHLQALADVVADFASKIRGAIDTTADWGDATTSDVFTQISREVDKDLWLLEAHLDTREVGQRVAGDAVSSGAREANLA